MDRQQLYTSSSYTRLDNSVIFVLVYVYYVVSVLEIFLALVSFEFSTIVSFIFSFTFSFSIP